MTWHYTSAAAQNHLLILLTFFLLHRPRLLKMSLSHAATTQEHALATPRIALPGRGTRPRQPKIRHLRHPIRAHQHVAGLDILVHQPELVGRMQPPGELDRHIEDRLQVPQPPLRDPGLERSAFHILGEDRELISNRAEEAAGDEVRMLG